MRIVARYSHQNGYEWVQYHKGYLWREIEEVIAAVDANAHRTKASKEARMAGRTLLSPKGLNAAFNREFQRRGWEQRQTVNWLSENTDLMREIVRLTPEEQRGRIERTGETPIRTYNQTDFVKERCAVEVQFGKYSFVAHDLYVKHMAFFLNDEIDLGVEVLPMKEMEREMSSGVAYYQRDLFNLIRQGRGVPSVPLILLGVAP